MNEEDCEAKMSNENWTATDCGKYIRVCAPNGGTCEMFGDSDDAHQRFAYFVLRQMIRDLAEVTEDRDAYRVSSEIRGANIEAMIESAPEAVREAFEAAWVMSRAVAIADSARVCKTWKEVCRRHGAACGADECMKLVAIQDED